MPKGIKTGGRQKGTPNKTTAELRDTIKQLINEAITPEFLASLTPEKRAEIIIKLLPFVLPKYTDIAQDSEGEKQPQIVINWSKPSEAS